MTTQRSVRTRPEAEAKAPAHAYVLEGTVMEACNCKVLCPCCAGEDPDNGSCDSVLAYHINRGRIGEVDVSNLTVVAVIHSPGNMFVGNWRRALVFDDRASHDQSLALTEAFEGRLGGPLADLAGLVGERLGPFWAPIKYELSEDRTSLTVGDKVRAVTTAVKSRSGTAVTRTAVALTNTMFGASHGSPARAGKTSEITINFPEHKMAWHFNGTHAAQSEFGFEA